MRTTTWKAATPIPEFVATLPAGIYTVEATTNTVRVTGSFTLSITAEEILSVNLSRAAGGENAQVRLGSPISLTATFSRPVSGFTDEDITVVNGVAGNFAVGDNDAIYTFEVTPDAIGEVTVDIAAGVAEDADGNGNTAATRFSLGITYDDNGDGNISKAEAIAAIMDYFDGEITKAQAIAVIRLYFTLSITAEEILSVNLSRAAGGENAQVRLGSPISLTATFSRPVSGFTDEDITVVNGVAGNFAVGDNDAIYTFEVTPDAIGEVTVDIAAGVAEDADGNGNTAAPPILVGNSI